MTPPSFRPTRSIFIDAEEARRCRRYSIQSRSDHVDQLTQRAGATSSPGSSRQETIHRYISESVDLLGEARINVFVPVLAHRFARERLKALAQAEGIARQGSARGALRLRP